MGSLIATPVLGTDPIEIGANRITPRPDLAMVSVATPRGSETELAAALKSGFGLDVPDATGSTQSDDMFALRMTPDQILLVFSATDLSAEGFVKSKLGGAGYTTDQSDALMVLDLDGPLTRAALERLCPVDLHDNAFPVGANARTIMEHMGATIHRVSETEFRLIAAGSSARSFLHAVETSFHLLPEA
ncbi:sarcosine oxidase subunit gamma [Primorskyibacter sp. S87]|uniref:sarcosine oxidase subunit gamma n=1 Tax=Primorskyibacter sp. S87 TaxID=3415126 RepID=UPI003C7E2D85